MAHIEIKEVAAFSSEDLHYPACNVLKGQKWLTDPQENAGKAVIELQLVRASQIHYIDIGYSNVASLEVTVGRSSWSISHYAILLPTMVLQTPYEARAGKNKAGCKMFNYAEHLNSEYANQKWDRVRILLNQPFAKKKQLGLEFIRLGSPRNGASRHKSDRIEVQSNSESSSITADWRDSRIARLASMTSEENKRLNDLEDKLLRISSTTEDGSLDKHTLRRTAKMVLSSQTENLKKFPEKLTEQCPLVSKSTASSVQKSRTLDMLCRTANPIQEYSPQQPHRLANRTIKRRSFDHLEFAGEVPTSNQLKKLSTSKLHHKTLDKGHNVPSKFTENKSNDSLNKNGIPPLGDSSLSTTCATNDFTIGGQRSNSPYTFKRTSMTGCSSGGDSAEKFSEGGCVVKDDSICLSQDTELTKSEVKRIKTDIKQFFNTLDMEEMDPDNVTLKELRTAFEAAYSINLDKDGRQYFRSITENFIELAVTIRRHKSRVGSPPNDAGECRMKERKRKTETGICPSSVNCAAEGLELSPAKVRRISRDSPRRTISLNEDCEIISVQDRTDMVQCPICMKNFVRNEINDHASLCGEDEEKLTSDLGPDLEITSVTLPPRHQNELFPRETVLDLSDNMRLTEEEKRHWVYFSKKPKPFHPRMDKSLFRGCELVKCPTCGQFYKSQDIEEHGDECAEKVNSGLEKRGLYYVRKDSDRLVKARR